MKKLMLAVGVATATLLAGCTDSATDAGSSSGPTPTSASPSAAPTPSTTPTPTPTPTPTGPVELTIEEAGDRFLTYICASNAANNKYSAALDKFDTYSSTSDTPHPKTVRAAERAAEAYAATAQALADPEYLWPENVRKDITTVANGAYEKAAWYASIAEAKAWEDVDTVRGSDRLAKAATASRLALGLPPRGECPKEYRP